ncbi:hypothetical protein MmiAt1_00360 [Methanimicrococcus sp. At1]|uniref:DNA alkylation repair enzyme n=1 Tax=Methanimicrococcus hacksteinii TaxID=3028293 RepID=A0ABU3VM80_9EURY|nr:DNA alkylation repair protein [Methanimicrococcus sp. At1]MDV0444510.1 hypothetical protein [Methanimicrococcus sp. At1]
MPKRLRLTVLAAEEIQADLEIIANPEKARHLQRYFKTGPGEYGEGDIFIGISVPEMRAAAKKSYPDVSLSETSVLLKSPIHEHRQTALFILVEKYNAACRKSPAKHNALKPNIESNTNLKESMREKKEIVAFYLDHLKFINNWDLTDSSASYILGEWFLETEPDTLGAKTIRKLAESENLWEQRISVMITHAFIRSGIYQPTLDLCEHFLPAAHDLIHKCTGWMLREAGKKDKSILIQFLDTHAEEMPRTMLRYSIEKLTPGEKEKYMAQTRKRIK